MGQQQYRQYIQSLTERLQLVELEWNRRTFQIPQFAIYAVLHKPVFDKIVVHKNRHIALIEEGRYTIPVVDPFHEELAYAPEFVVVINHTRGNHFGLFAYPANKIKSNLSIPYNHHRVEQIVRDFV